ncbi:MAG: DMT family transporter [Silicimonas sp.]|nr:DMT family transporter [Silicimonas sp.]
MGLAMVMFSAVDTTAKFLTEELHPIQIAWTRQLGLLAGAAMFFAIQGTALFRTSHLTLQVTRGLLAVCSATLFIFALRNVALADAVAISFLAPFIVTVMGALVLGEPVGMRRWIAVTLGFIGSLIVIRPGLGVMHPTAGLVVIAAFCFACRQIISRAIADTDKTSTTVAYTAVSGVLAVGVFLPWVWVTPTGNQIMLLAMLASLSCLAEICVIKALEMTQAVIVAPMQYTLIIWGTFAGWMVFGQLPDLWTWLGTALIVATGLYTLRREYMVSRAHRLKMRHSDSAPKSV